MKNIFELATRKKLRFASIRGELTTEQLWDLPTTSKTGFDLDTLAKAVNKELKSQEEESFVKTSKNMVAPVLSLKLEVLKRVIEVKLQEADQAAARVANAQKREQLLEALAQVETRELLGKGKNELLAELRQLEG